MMGGNLKHNIVTDYGLLQLVLLMSLINSPFSPFPTLDLQPNFYDIIEGSSWIETRRDFHRTHESPLFGQNIHPKSLMSSLSHERVFNELNLLGRYSRPPVQEILAYMNTVDEGNNITNSENEEDDVGALAIEILTEPHEELLNNDAEWFTRQYKSQFGNSILDSVSTNDVLQEEFRDISDIFEETQRTEYEDDITEGSSHGNDPTWCCTADCSADDEDSCSAKLEEVETDSDAAGEEDLHQKQSREPLTEDPDDSGCSFDGIFSNLEGIDESLDEDPESVDMLQTAQFHPHYSRPMQGRFSLMPSLGMDQRWQDFASMINHTSTENGLFPHHHSQSYPPTGPCPVDPHRGVLLHNASLASQATDINGTYPTIPMSLGGNIGSAVASSINLTNTSESSVIETSAQQGQHVQDGIFYQAHGGEISAAPPVNEGYFPQVLNEEEIQLMDIAMTEGMYTMRMLEHSSGINTTVREDSDSAVSSMGSERVPSDGEWVAPGNDSDPNCHLAQYNLEYSSNKYHPYNYSCLNRNVSVAERRISPIPQKKYHLYGKKGYHETGGSASSGVPSNSSSLHLGHFRFDYGMSNMMDNSRYFGAQGGVDPSVAMSYGCNGFEYQPRLSDSGSLNDVHHNHSYVMSHPGAAYHKVNVSSKDAKKNCKREDEHLSRDEKKARSMNIPLTIDDIVNLPMDEFNERLSKYDLTEAQLSLIRDIRRRGKNKVAAQNCRKRKMDQILTLAEEVRGLHDRREKLLSEKEYLVQEYHRVKDKFGQLYRHVFQSLRDPEGQPYSSYEWSLQQSADGSIVLVPRNGSSSSDTSSRHKRDTSYKPQ